MITELISVSVTALRNAETYQDIELSWGWTKGINCFDRLAAVDHTNDMTSVTFGFRRGADVMLIDSYVTVVANRVVATQQPIYMPGEYRPFVRIRGGTAGDVITLYVYGYRSNRQY